MKQDLVNLMLNPVRGSCVYCIGWNAKSDVTFDKFFQDYAKIDRFEYMSPVAQSDDTEIEFKIYKAWQRIDPNCIYYHMLEEV